MTADPQAHHGPAGAGAARTEIAGPFARGMAAAMEQMMTAMHTVSLSGNPDQDFLAMMAPHHAGAVEMARLLLLYGHDPLTRQLAEEILAGQMTELAAMQARLAVLRSSAVEYPTLGGTRGSMPTR